MLSEQTANRFAAVPASTAQLVEQFVRRPWRLAPSIPVRQHMQRLVIVQSESSGEPATDTKCVDIAVLASNGGWD